MYASGAAHTHSAWRLFRAPRAAPGSAAHTHNSDEPMDKLNEIYTDEKSGASFSGAERLYREAKRRGLNFTRKDVRTFLRGKPSWSRYRLNPRRFRRSKIISYWVNDFWEADLAWALFPKANYQNYWLIIVDCLSQYLRLVSLKKKTTEEVTKAFASIFSREGVAPSVLTTDAGTEFRSHHFLELLKSYGVEQHVARGKKG